MTFDMTDSAHSDQRPADALTRNMGFASLFFDRLLKLPEEVRSRIPTTALGSDQWERARAVVENALAVHIPPSREKEVREAFDVARSSFDHAFAGPLADLGTAAVRGILVRNVPEAGVAARTLYEPFNTIIPYDEIDQRVAEAIPLPVEGEPTVELSGVIMGSSSLTGDLTAIKNGPVHEGVSINELVDHYLLEDALRAGGSVAWHPTQIIHETEYLRKVLEAANILERRGNVVVEAGFMGRVAGPLRLTLTDAGRQAAEEARAETERVRRGTAERRSVPPADPVLSRGGDRGRLQPAIAIAWNPAVVTPEEYAELVEILGNLARLEGAQGISRIKSQGLEVPAGEAVTL